MLQNRKLQQFNIKPDQQQDTTTLQNVPDPSETATKQNLSELSGVTVKIPQSFTISNDSNILQIPVHNITQNPINDQMTKLIIQTETIHLPYLHQILIKLNHFKHNISHLETLILLLLPNNI